MNSTDFFLVSLCKNEHANLWCDTYVDRTFHWLNPDGILPYNHAWIGFVHHTFDSEEYTDYNNQQLLKNPLFIASLQQCQALIVFTEVLRKRWVSELEQRGFVDVQVFVMSHATEFVPEASQFSVDKFRANRAKKLVQVGAWLRDTYAIFLLDQTRLNLGLQKAALVGMAMQHYYKPINFFNALLAPHLTPVIAPPSRETFRSNDRQPSNSVMSTNGLVPLSARMVQAPCEDDHPCRVDTRSMLSNKYVQGAVNHLKSIDETVTLLSKLDNDAYDELLMTNVVFLNLIDAGAVNTILECIVRNTPVVVNWLPGVEEYLGEKYPLFYDTIDQVPGLVTLDTIDKACRYLQSMDKTRFKIESFMNDFKIILRKITLKKK
ncbi:hypothetical protein BJ741DRAFT_655112 [Chytriomyces cf. hyalinus JEL632]|nr:hypothetical protein BJ741DRAFT_655112 [Chytriomyces cf. hyalinus JEL632]